MSKPDAPFEPLMAPRLSPASPPAETISWLEHIAPHLAAESHLRTVSPVKMGQALAKGVRKAEFMAVDEIAARERALSHVLEPELPEITKLRMEAATEAQRIVSEALVQAQSIEQEAKERGYQTGYVRGMAEGRREAERQVLLQADDERAAYREDLHLFIAHIESERRRAWGAMEPMITTIIFELARKVIKKEVEVSREVALAVIQNALRRVNDSTTLRIRVHAEDLQTVRSNREDLLHLVDGNRHLEIIEDRRVDVGGCIVETEAGKIDASIETQLQEIANLLERL